MKYLLRHLGLYLLAAWAALTLNFILPRTMPGDPVTSLIGRMRGRFTPEQIQATRALYGFDNGSIFQQYAEYVSHIVKGDFGTSFSAYPVQVSTIISAAFIWTILLGIVVLVLGFAIGTILGVIVTWRRGGWVDSILPGLFNFIGSFPYFFLAMLAVFVLGFVLKRFPMWHAYSDKQ